MIKYYIMFHSRKKEMFFSRVHSVGSTVKIIFSIRSGSKNYLLVDEVDMTCSLWYLWWSCVAAAVKREK